MNPILAALLAQPWAMDEVRLRAMIAELETVLAAGAPSEAMAFFGYGSAPKAQELRVENGVATIPIHGVMMKSIPSILKAFGFGGADIGDIREQLLKAVFRDDVREICLDIDSPGGEVFGTKDLADEVHAARGLKPVVARASGNMASAAYWVGSQANRITATASSVIGHIGVVATLTDTSKAAEDAGIKVHVIGSNALKGAGTFGAAVTDPQLEDLRALVMKFSAMFNADIARGRGMKAPEVEAVATGATWVGVDAKAKGLVDEIEKSKVKQKETAMDIEKLKAELAEMTAKFGAESARATKLAQELEAATKRLAELEAGMKQAQATQRDMLIARYEAHVAPADLAAVKEYGEFCGADMAKFEGFLRARAPATRPARVSDAGGDPNTPPKPDLTPAVLAVAKQMGNSAEDLAKASAA